MMTDTEETKKIAKEIVDILKKYDTHFSVEISVLETVKYLLLKTQFSRGD